MLFNAGDGGDGMVLLLLVEVLVMLEMLEMLGMVVTKMALSLTLLFITVVFMLSVIVVDAG